VVSDLESHPLPRLLEAGVPVTLGADDSLMFGSGIADEYVVARDAFALSDEQLAEIARTSVRVSGASAATKQQVVADIDAWLAADPVRGRAQVSR
jgi:adenosine deaminase